MAEKGQSREEELRRLLTDAIEVQLAALRAGIGFWTEWIEHTSEFVQSATRSLSMINTRDQQTKDVLLELLDAGRASLRSMTEIPRHTAARFIEELDRVEQQKKEQARPERPAAKKPPAGAGGARAAPQASRPREGLTS